MKFKNKIIYISTALLASAIAILIFLPNLQALISPIPFNEIDIPFGSVVSPNPNCNFGTNPTTGKCNPTYGYPSVECNGANWGVTGCPKTTTTTITQTTQPSTTGFETCTQFQSQFPTFQATFPSGSYCYPNPQQPLPPCPSGYYSQGVTGMNVSPYTSVEICPLSTSATPTQPTTSPPTSSNFVTTVNQYTYQQYTNRILPCDINAFVQVYYTDGTFDTIQSNTVFFYPNVLSFYSPSSVVLQNPNTLKTVNYFQLQPQLICNFPSSFTSTAQVSGSYKFYYYAYYSTMGTILGRTPVFSLTANIPTTTFGTLQTVNLGSPQQVYPSTIIPSIPTTATGIGLVTFVTPSLGFYVPDAQQTSSWTGNIYFSNVGFNLKVTNPQPNIQPSSPTPTPSPAPTPPATATSGISLNGKIHYKIFYQNGNTQAGDAQDVRTVGVQKLSLFGGAGQPVPNAVTDITYTVLIGDNGQGVNLSNPQLQLGGTVTVGSSPPFSLASSDFKTTIVNDINYGLETVDLPVNTLNQEIQNHYGPAPANPQQVSVTLTVNGQFTAQYQGSTYNGQITDLSWTFPSMYGTSSSSSTSTFNANGGGCAQNQGSSQINPYGSSPSSAQSFNCGQPVNKNCNFGTNPNDGTCNQSIGLPAVECNGGIWGVTGCNSSSPSTTSPSSTPTSNGGTYGTTSQTTPTGTCFLPNGIANPLAGPNCNAPSTGSPNTSPISNNPTIPPFGSGGTAGFCTDGTTGLACLAELIGVNQNPTLWGIVGAVIGIIIVSSIVIKVKRRHTA